MTSKQVVFHAHIYFDTASIKEAEKLRELSHLELTSIVLGVSQLINRPIGPHPTPMFEIDFYEQYLGQLTEWLYKNRGAFSVLIHKDVSPERIEHTVNALWIGTPLKLDLTKLDLGTDAVHNQIMNK